MTRIKVIRLFLNDLLGLAASVKELNWSSYKRYFIVLLNLLKITISHETIRKSFRCH